MPELKRIVDSNLADSQGKKETSGALERMTGEKEGE